MCKNCSEYQWRWRQGCWFGVAENEIGIYAVDVYGVQCGWLRSIGHTIRPIFIKSRPKTVLAVTTLLEQLPSPPISHNSFRLLLKTALHLHLT